MIKILIVIGIILIQSCTHEENNFTIDKTKYITKKIQVHPKITFLKKYYSKKVKNQLPLIKKF